MTEMTWNAPLWWDDKKPLPMEGMFVAEALKLTSQEMERRWARRPKAGKKRNWQAAAIAKVAREIWAEEEWRTHPDKYGPDIFLNYLYVLGLPEPEMNSALRKRAEYERHKQEYSTRCEKHDAPGPFGRFLNDVMQTLNVQGSAATALNSLKEAEKQLSQRK